MIGNNETISKYKIIFISNWSEEVFLISKIKNTVSWTYMVNINGEEIAGNSYEKEFQKTNIKRIYNRKSNYKQRKQATCQMERLW